MFVPIDIVPTVTFLGFVGFAVRYCLRKQWRNAAICLLVGIAFVLMFFLALQALQVHGGQPAALDRERARITALEQRVSALEAQLQKMPQQKEPK